MIVNWNTREHLRRCLATIYKESAAINFEIIVIDNASTDGSVDMIKIEFPQIILIENSSNKGFAAANNRGIVLAGGRYVLLLNPDTILIEYAIGKTVLFADSKPEAAVIGCRVLNPDKTLQQTCFMFPSLLNMALSMTYLYKFFPKSRFFGRERMTWWSRDNEREVDVVTGCFMLVRREAIEQVGLMDERFFVYGEETDWCYRFKQKGWKVVFTPDARIIHFGGQSSKQMAPEMALQLRGSILRFMRKHRSFFEYLIACVLVWLFFAVRVPVWFVKYLIDKEKRDYSWLRMVTYLTGMKRLIFNGADGLCIKA